MLKANSYTSSLGLKAPAPNEKSHPNHKRHATLSGLIPQSENSTHRRTPSDLNSKTPSNQARAFLNEKRKASVTESSHFGTSKSPTSHLKNVSYASGNRVLPTQENDTPNQKSDMNQNRPLRERHQALTELSMISNGSRIAKRTINLQEEPTSGNKQKTENSASRNKYSKQPSSASGPENVKISQFLTGNSGPNAMNSSKSSQAGYSSLQGMLRGQTLTQVKGNAGKGNKKETSHSGLRVKATYANKSALYQLLVSPTNSSKENTCIIQNEKSPTHIKQQAHQRVQSFFVSNNSSPCNVNLNNTGNASHFRFPLSYAASPTSQNQSLIMGNPIPRVYNDSVNNNNTSTSSAFEMIYRKIDSAHRLRDSQPGSTRSHVVSIRERNQSVPEVVSIYQKDQEGSMISKPYLNGITEEACNKELAPSGNAESADVSRRSGTSSIWYRGLSANNDRDSRKEEMGTETNKADPQGHDEKKILEERFKEHIRKQISNPMSRFYKNQTQNILEESVRSKIDNGIESYVARSPVSSHSTLPLSESRLHENIRNFLHAKNNTKASQDLADRVKTYEIHISDLESKPSHKKNSKSLGLSKQTYSVHKSTEIESPQCFQKKSSIPNVSYIKCDITDLENVKSASKGQDMSNLESVARDLQREAYVREKLKDMNRERFKAENNCPKTTLDYYRLVKMIGKGSFGIVYLGVHLLTGCSVAIKAIDKKFMQDEQSKQKVLQEVAILKQANHRNIIQLLEMFENSNHLFIVLEYASQGDLLTFVKNKGKLGEELAKKVFVQIVAGVKYCHQNKILHRDIKLDNILLDHNFVVKLCDFGVSRFIEEGQVIKEQCGTPVYVAPEVINGKGYEGYDSDIWSLGVLLFAILTGNVPFKAKTIEELKKMIANGKYTCPESMTQECKDLIQRMLTLDPNSRIRIDQILAHKWLNKIPTLENEGKMEKGSTIQIIDTVVRKVEALGYPREIIIQSVRQCSYNHISACYFLFYKDYIDSMW